MVENIGDKIEHTITNFADLLAFDKPQPDDNS